VAKRAGPWPRSSQTRRTAKSPGGRIVSDVIVSSNAKSRPNGAIAIGGYIALAGLWAAPISGASMNPARSLAPDLVRGQFATTWIYIAGPLSGAIIAVAFEWILKGPATREGTRTAQGAPDER
jgi:hypothetical protein